MKNTKWFQVGVWTVCIAGVVALTGCKTPEKYRKERAEYAVFHFEKARMNCELEEKRKLSLPECIQLALKNNLDLKVSELEVSMAKELRTAEMLGMLPELNVTNNLAHRTNTPASSSRQLDGDGYGTYSYSTSQDRTVNYLNVDLALSVLDFGLAFFNTIQAEDRMQLRNKRTERAKQNLTLDVVRVYFQVAAAQRAKALTEDLLKKCRAHYGSLATLGREQKLTPFRAFDEARRFLEMEKRLTNYVRNYENACAELRSLMGYYPTGVIEVDDKVLDKMPEFEKMIPETTLMEQIALLQRPELYEIDMQKHINIVECYKTIAMMFPNARIFMDFNHSNNSFLYHSTWWELGIRAAYNLLKLPQHIARYQAYSAQVDAEEMRTYAQAIGIMAQVRMAHANMIATRERLKLDDNALKIYKENLEWAKANKNITGELSQLELDHIELSTTEVQIERFLTMGNYYISYYRLMNTLGIEDLHKKSIEGLEKELSDAKVRAKDRILEARAEVDAEKKRRKDAEMKKAEEQKKAAEMKKAEEQKKAAALKKAESQKKAQAVPPQKGKNAQALKKTNPNAKNVKKNPAPAAGK